MSFLRILKNLPFHYLIVTAGLMVSISAPLWGRELIIDAIHTGLLIMIIGYCTGIETNTAPKSETTDGVKECGE
jgi:hypothetical protein